MTSDLLIDRFNAQLGAFPNFFIENAESLQLRINYFDVELHC